VTIHPSHKTRQVRHLLNVYGAERSYDYACAYCGVSLMHWGCTAGLCDPAAAVQCAKRKPIGPVVRFLVWIGFVRFRDGVVRWPFDVDPWWMWKANFWPAVGKREPIFGVFRNLPHVIKWEKGRLLPRRWGIRFLGFEFGDRG